MQGYCIEEGHKHNETESSLPSREFFINDLFDEKQHLSEEVLEDIVKILGISKVADEGDSHGHDHRRRRSAGSNMLQQRGSRAPHSVHRRAADDHHDHGHGASGSVSYTGE